MKRGSQDEEELDALRSTGQAVAFPIGQELEGEVNAR